MKEKKLTTCLWFDDQAEEAANFYTTIFRNSGIKSITRYGNEGNDIHGKKAGSVMTVEFYLNDNSFIALNGGPVFKFSEAISFQIFCDTQDEIDYYWNHLSEGGEEGQCGWLKDKYGLSWQVIPSILQQLLNDPAKSESVTRAFLKMKKFEIDGLLEA